MLLVSETGVPLVLSSIRKTSSLELFTTGKKVLSGKEELKTAILTSK